MAESIYAKPIWIVRDRTGSQAGFTAADFTHAYDAGQEEMAGNDAADRSARAKEMKLSGDYKSIPNPLSPEQLIELLKAQAAAAASSKK